MNVIVTGVVAIKPGILRVACYTTTEGALGGDYEITIVERDFITETDEHNVEIDLDKFKLLVSQEIARIRNTANLASALNAADLEWTIDIDDKALTEDKETPSSVEGMSLAYGDNVSNESTST